MSFQGARKIGAELRENNFNSIQDIISNVSNNTWFKEPGAGEGDGVAVPREAGKRTVDFMFETVAKMEDANA
jgi:hypothetical protein